MALRGADIDSEALRSGEVAIYLNSFQRTRAWVGSDELSYAPGEVVRGTAYLKNSPHHARRQLVLSQVDVYLSAECARRKVNNTYQPKGIDARRQNLNEIYYTRRGGPRHNSYKSYYNYGETVPSRESPFRGPYQAQYHYKASRFIGASGNINLEENFHEENDDCSIASSNFSDPVLEVLSSKKDDSILSSQEKNAISDPNPIRCCVFKASRDGGPRPLPATPYEAPFRFSFRIPDDAPENYAWAEEKNGCCLEIRYRLYVVFKLRAQPRDAAHAEDPLYWEGAVRNGESPLIVLFSESWIGIDPAPNDQARNDVYTKNAAMIGAPPIARRKPKSKRRSFLGRRSLIVESPEELEIGDELMLTANVKCPISMKKGESPRKMADVKIDLIEKAVLKQGRKTCFHKSTRTVSAKCALDNHGEGAIVISVNTKNEKLYPTARIGNLVVRHELRVTLCPGDRFSINARFPVTLLGGKGRFLTRNLCNTMLYPTRSRQPPWRKNHMQQQQRETLRRKEISEKIDRLTTCTSKEKEKEECVICLDDSLPEKSILLRCAHRIHAECAKEWMFRREDCPVCNEPFSFNQVDLDASRETRRIRVSKTN